MNPPQVDERRPSTFQREKMKKEFEVIVEKEGAELVVTCPAVPDARARAPTVEKAIEKMKQILAERSKGSGETEHK